MEKDPHGMPNCLKTCNMPRRQWHVKPE